MSETAIASMPSRSTLGKTQRTAVVNAGPRPWGRVSSQEWRWIAIVTALILLMTQGPPTVQRLAGPSDRVHLGNYWYATDFSAYSAAMLEGATSDSWLIHNPATAEPHHPALMFPLYVTIGKAATATGMPMLALFAAVEMLTRILLPVTIYLFVATFLLRVRDRRFAFLLAAFSAGLTLFLVPLLDTFDIKTTLGGQPSVQVVTFALFFTAPHLGLGLVATLTSMIAFSAACRGSRVGLILVAVSVFALGLVHPFNLPTVISTFGLYTLARMIGERRVTIRPILACVVAGIAGVPLLLYNFVTFTLDPFWSKTHGEANTLPSPRPWELPMDYGIVFVLALVGAVVLTRSWRGQPRSIEQGNDGGSDALVEQPLMTEPGILVAWLVTGLVWMYVPLAYQHRLAFGLQPAMAVLAAVGWRPTVSLLGGAITRFAHVRARLARSTVSIVLIVLALSLPSAVYLGLLTSAATNAPIKLYSLDRDTYEVGQWLASHTGTEDVTLGSVTTGVVLSGFLPSRVVIARPAGTIDFPEKLKEVEAMYEGQLSDADLLRFLRANRVSYIVVGPEERKLGPNDPGAQLGLPVVDGVGGAVAYRLPPG